MTWSDTLTLFVTGAIVGVYLHDLQRLREQVRPAER